MSRRERPIVNEEIHFLPEEFFFSMTDRRGIILGGNDVFVRISGYGIEELVGKNHNIIRHPDMPRAVFRLLWQTIQAGKPITAYVKNRAKSGKFYWVVANVYPLGERYLSVRFRPTTDLRKTVEEVYRQMVALEEDGGMERSTDFLLNSLETLGFCSYEEFEFAMLVREWRSLDGLLDCSRTKADVFAQKIQAVCAGYRRLFEEFEQLVQLVEAMRGQSAFLRELASDIRSHAINSSIAATRLGSEGLAIAAVSRELGTCIREGDGDLRLADETARESSAKIMQSGLALCHLRTLLQALPEFAREIGQATEGWAATYNAVDNLTSLLELIRKFLDTFNQNLTSLAQTLLSQEKLLGRIQRLNQTLGLIRVAGSTNLAHMTNRGEFEAVFDRLREAVATTAHKLNEFLSEAQRAGSVARHCQAEGMRWGDAARKLAAEFLQRAHASA